MGGTDHSSNLVELTIEEHAEAHRKLFEEHGRWQDEIAWKTLSGQISNAEAIKMAQILANKGKIVSETTKQKLRVYNSGKTLSKEHRLKISESCKGKLKKHRKKETKPRNRDYTEMRLIVQCPHCERFGAKNLMKRYHFDNCKFRNIIP